MATIRIFLGIICLVSTFGHRLPSGGFLSGLREQFRKLDFINKTPDSIFRRFNSGQWSSKFQLSTPNSSLRPINFTLPSQELEDRSFLTPNFGSFKNDGSSYVHGIQRLPASHAGVWLLKKARSQLHIREATGKNDGLAVEAYLKYTGHQKGAPWCASFVSWVFGQVGFSEPRTAWSPALFPITKKSKLPKPAHVFGIYFTHLKRIAHCGLVEEVNANWVTTIEGNTSNNGVREGDGVYRKRRHDKTIAVYADWISVPKKGELK